jgi:hypothetical protein
MSRLTVESLPLIALDLLCEYLAHCDYRRSSLFAFSLTSKICYGAARRQCCKRILLDEDSPETMMNALRKWRQMLGEDGRKYVRQVKVTGSMSSNNIDEDEIDNQLYWRWYYPRGREVRLPAVIEDEVDQRLQRTENDCFLEPATSNFPLYRLKFSMYQDNQDDHIVREDVWEAISSFITTLPGLRDFVWLSTNQLKLCILLKLDSVYTRFNCEAYMMKRAPLSLSTPISTKLQ